MIAAAAYLLPDGTMTGAEAKPDATGALVAHVPPSFAGSCVPGEDVQRPFRRRLAAAVVCTAAAPASVDYYQYEDDAALQAAFDEVVHGVEDAGCGEDGTYPGGRLACWRIKGASVIAWTDERAADPRAGRRARYGARRAPALVAARFRPNLSLKSR